MMMFVFFCEGGDVDAASKTLLGVCKTSQGFHFLIAVSQTHGLTL